MLKFDVLLAIHVLAVVWWVGGVAMVTAVLLPMFNRLPADERIQRIKQLEARFANQARIAVAVVGITGFWMLGLSGGFARLQFAYGWWIDLMLLVWVLFAVMLFVVEPLRLPAKIGVIQSPRRFLAIHCVLLALALATIFCGVIGARGVFQGALILFVIPESRSDIRTAFAGLQTRTPKAARRASAMDGAVLMHQCVARKPLGPGFRRDDGQWVG